SRVLYLLTSVLRLSVPLLRPRPFILFFLLPRRPPRSPLFPYTTLFRSYPPRLGRRREGLRDLVLSARDRPAHARRACPTHPDARSEEHTSELQSRENLVCRLLLEKKKKMPDCQHPAETTHRPTSQRTTP